MFNVNDTCYVDISVGNINVEITSFISLLIKQDTHENIPIFQLKVSQSNYEMMEYLRNNKTNVSVNIGMTNDNMEEYDFSILDYYVDNDGSKIIFTMFGILNIYDYTNVIKIDSKEGTSDEIINSVKGVFPKIYYEGNDKQIWIRRNQSEKDLVDDVYMHSFINTKTFPIYCVNTLKDLVVIDYNKRVSDNPEYTFSTIDIEEEKTILYTSMRIETNRGLYNRLLGENRKVSVLNMVKHIVEKSELPNEDSIKENYDFPIVYDNGNCHPNYYIAEKYNMKMNTELKKFCIILTVTNTFLREKDVPMLSVVKLRPDDNSPEINSTMTGNYIITHKSLFLDKSKMSQEVILNRI